MKEKELKEWHDLLGNLFIALISLIMALGILVVLCRFCDLAALRYIAAPILAFWFTVVVYGLFNSKKIIRENKE